MLCDESAPSDQSESTAVVNSYGANICNIFFLKSSVAEHLQTKKNDLMSVLSALVPFCQEILPPSISRSITLKVLNHLLMCSQEDT